MMSQHELLYYLFFFTTCLLTVISICLYIELKKCKRENVALTVKLTEYFNLLRNLF